MKFFPRRIEIGSLHIIFGETWTNAESPHFQYRLWGLSHRIFRKLFGSYVIGWPVDAGVFPYNEGVV